MKEISRQEIFEKAKDYKFLIICGNGGSGKTTLAKSIANDFEKLNKSVNLISTDDFIVDTELRKNSQTFWVANEKTYHGRYTSCCQGSYFLRGLLPVIYALSKNEDAYILPKRSEIVKLNGKADLTIIEGIGTAFLPPVEKLFDSLMLWVECDKQTEIERRVLRDKHLSREQIEAAYEDRTSQFVANVLPFKKNFDFTLHT